MLYQNILPQKDKPNLFYVVAGTEDYVDEDNYPRSTSLDDRVYAKAVADKPTKHFHNNRGLDYRYYIRMSPNRQLINPIDILSTVKDKLRTHYRAVGKIYARDTTDSFTPTPILSGWLSCVIIAR